MTTRTTACVALTWLVLGVVGCQGPQPSKPGVTLAEDMITVEALAARLGLRVDERDGEFVVLKDASNTVILFTHSQGRFFVNGKPLGSVGRVQRDGATAYVPQTLLAQIRPHLRAGGQEPPVTPAGPAKGTVVVDAGHGGRDPGASSAAGVREKNVNLRVAAKIARLLEKRGVAVKMTRWQDRYIELEDRADVANQLKADLFVSIHADAAPSRDAEGFTIYLARTASPNTRRAARSINQAMARTGTAGRGIREQDYRVLVGTQRPAVLIELGYLSNPREAARLNEDAYQTKLAQAIVNGIVSYLR